MAYLRRLLNEFLEEDGLLLAMHYRASGEDLTKGWLDAELRAEGFNVLGYISGFDSIGREKCRATMVQP